VPASSTYVDARKRKSSDLRVEAQRQAISGGDRRGDPAQAFALLVCLPGAGGWHVMDGCSDSTGAVIGVQASGGQLGHKPSASARQPETQDALLAAGAVSVRFMSRRRHPNGYGRSMA